MQRNCWQQNCWEAGINARGVDCGLGWFLSEYRETVAPLIYLEEKNMNFVLADCSI